MLGNEDTPDPYPKPGPNMKQRLMIPFEKILKQFEELPEAIKNNHTGKVGCIFPMAIFSILPHVEFGVNDHQADAHYIERFFVQTISDPLPLRSHTHCKITIL